MEVKEKCLVAIEGFLAPIRERRSRFEKDKGFVEQIIIEGTAKTNELANETLARMKKAMGLTGLWNKIGRTARDRLKKG